MPKEFNVQLTNIMNFKNVLVLGMWIWNNFSFE